jgi:outer membrane receptor protein involved in Fe transport
LGTALNGDHSFTRLNPALGMAYDLKQGVNLYAGYSESNRAPTAMELTCADPQDPCRLPNAFLSDPPLEQVVAKTWEADEVLGDDYENPRFLSPGSPRAIWAGLSYKFY